MPPAQPRLLRLDEAAELSGVPVEELRRRCATGRLHCERAAGEWLILERELRPAMTTTARRTSRSGRSIVAAAFGDAGSARRAATEIRSGLADRVRDLALSRLALDGHEYTLLAGSFPDDAFPLLESIVRSHHGTVVDDVDEERTGMPARGVARDRAQTSYS